MQVDQSLFKDLYLWVGAVELRIYVFKRLDRRKIQSFSELSVTTQAKVSSSLDGAGHQIWPSEPQGSVHEVCQGANEIRAVNITL